MVYRIYVEKKPGLDNEARSLLNDARSLLGIQALEAVRLFNRYDVEGIGRELFDYAVHTVFSEPQLDLVYEEPELWVLKNVGSFSFEFMGGGKAVVCGYDCAEFSSVLGERPCVGMVGGTVYVRGPVPALPKDIVCTELAQEDIDFLLSLRYTIPTGVETLTGFTSMDIAELEGFVLRYGLAMDADDLAFCQAYFRTEQREPTITELRVLDTYWSDHCRHTTFNTVIDSVRFEDALLQNTYEDYLRTREELGRTKAVCLMDLATLAVRFLRKTGKLDKLDESEEINACTVKITVNADGKAEPWLLLFKNETHNHPTEIEPFGGAATCIGGAIRDPLSGRAYVYGAMRVTGAADPTVPVSETIPGKIPQRKLVTTAAAGYSSYGNQIGLATGIVDELYHPGYAAKRMEIGAVIAAAPAENVRRERPEPGDVVILLGGSTGRDGIGGATGSSKAHNVHSVETCGAEVQKGNAPEERKLQRLFRNGDACRLIKRCNDFGAGGVSVAIGELADGLDIDLNQVPRKYEGLDGTELAISESQERMAVVIEKENVNAFLALAKGENLQACPVAVVTAEPRLKMRWNGVTIVDLSRAFLDTNGASKHTTAEVAAPQDYTKTISGSFAENLRATVSDLNCCSKRGLSERFDSTIGAGTVLMPFGGKYQLTPVQAMVQNISMEKNHTDSCSLMAWGYNPYIAEKSPYHGAYLAVVESICKLVASGSAYNDVYLSFQEYFERLGKDPKRWGKPVAALLGAFRAQTELGVGAIGGKDSMSGSFEQLDVPPTLVSFAENIVSPECKRAGHRLYRLAPDYGADGLPLASSLLALFDRITLLQRKGMAVACYTPGMGGIAEAVFKMCIGNGLGFRFEPGLSAETLFRYDYGAFLLESAETIPDAECLGSITDDRTFSLGSESVSLAELLSLYEGRLEPVYPCNIPNSDSHTDAFSCCASAWPAPTVKNARPRVLIPVFPGTNCEYDSAKAVSDAGAEPEILIINNLSSNGIARSVDRFAALLKESQIVFIPGGFSGGDEPDGSGKFITAFFRSAAVKDGVTELLDRRDGLMCGICNGFQALIKLGLVPYGRIVNTDADSPTLTFNRIGRHQSRIVRTRIASNKSPWLSLTEVGEIYSVPISHGEGRFLASEELVRTLAANGQIATQYVDLEGNVSADVHFNPNGSIFGVEGITSPDGRVFGKMGHSERIGSGLYRNVPGNYDIRMFEAAVQYFK